ncbi:MAG: hypothetical protein ACP5N1_01915 [Candidatus Woesearchaeota archaeon]
MISNNDFFNQRKSAIVLTLIIMLVGTIFYFGTGIYKQSSMSNGMSNNASNYVDSDVLELISNSKLKVVHTPEGTIKIFAFANNDYLKNIDVYEGSNVVIGNDLIIGKLEADMMRKEKLFLNIGDNITDLFGLNISIKGVLSKTNTFIDDFHFISEDNYVNLNDEEGRLLIKFKDEKTPKLFYLYNYQNNYPDYDNIKIELAEGNINDYSIQSLDSRIYYPIIIGYDEAMMMREEKLFTSVGDTLDNFFGRDIIIVGVIKKTNTSVDMIHFVQPDFFEANSRKGLV